MTYFDFSSDNTKNIINNLVTKYKLNEKYINALKYTQDKDYHILILNLNILFKNNAFTATDIIHTILSIEKSGYKFHCQINYYIYFLKKKSLFDKLFKK